MAAVWAVVLDGFFTEVLDLLGAVVALPGAGQRWCGGGGGGGGLRLYI